MDDNEIAKYTSDNCLIMGCLPTVAANLVYMFCCFFVIAYLKSIITSNLRFILKINGSQRCFIQDALQ
jgi:hypothetical protein